MYTQWYYTECSFSEEPTKAPSVKNGSCPGFSWLKHDSYCYLPVPSMKRWQDARLYCAQHGLSATLVSIHSDDENKFVYENIPKRGWHRKSWIGLYRHTKGSSWFSLTYFPQNGRHFADDIFRCILVNESFVFWIKFVSKGSIDNSPAVHLDNDLVPSRRQAIVLNQCWPDSLTHICGIRGGMS